VHALLSQIIEPQLLQESFWGVKASSLALYIIQPQELLQHLLWSLEREVCEPVALHHAPQRDDSPLALAKDKF